MDKREIDYINNELAAQDWLKITQVVSQEAVPNHDGKFEIDTIKGTLQFDVNISPDFPLGKIDFVCVNHRGYGHMMHYGHICLNAAPSTTVSGRLAAELEKLHLWLQKYFIEEHIDAHFEYYHFPIQRATTVVFEETAAKEAVSGECGKFEYAELNHFTVGDNTLRCWIAMDLGGRKCQWAAPFKNRYTKKYTGLWLKLQHPPVLERRQTIDEWKDLLSLLSTSQSKFLNDTYNSVRKQSGYTDCLILMIGYEISDVNNHEMHWDTVLIHFDEFPFTSVKLGPGTFGPSDLGYKVVWGKSLNASYERMFGRGKLSDMLTEKKILIIGTGAIGSQLFDVLLRGGCRYIELCEPDIIEPGNVCRGDFSFVNTYKPKLFELYNKAVNVSPHVNIHIAHNISAMTSDNKDYAPTKQKLQGFDFIFDCSTDKYLSIMLDSMQLGGQIVNFSITNAAKDMAVITGLGNIHIAKSALYDRLVPDSSEPFFVATGCWHPTFRASYPDILILLTYALNEINHRLSSGHTLNSFFITRTADHNKPLNYELSYNV